MNENRFPDFTGSSASDLAKELKRPFKVCEHCYDCVEFYGEGHGSYGCNAWPVNKPFRCADYYRLPDVMPGTCGQVFPPSRMQGRKEPRELAAPDTSPSGPRHCDCGETLAKGRRLCDQCRSQRRQQTKRDYMKGYMQQRRSAASVSVADTPSPSTRRPSTQPVSDDLLPAGTAGGGRLS